MKIYLVEDERGWKSVVIAPHETAAQRYADLPGVTVTIVELEIDELNEGLVLTNLEHE